MIFEKIKKKASLKKFLIFTVIFIVMFVPMNTFVSKWQENVDLTFMDFIFGGYGTEDVYQVLNTIGESGRNTYKYMIGLDCIMGILYLFLLSCLIALVLKKVLRENKKFDWLIFMPLVAMVSDWTENITTFCIIQMFPTINATLVSIESLATTLKFVFLAVSIGSVAIISIYGVWKMKLQYQKE